MKKVVKIIAITLVVVCILGTVTFSVEDLTQGMNINLNGKNAGFVGKFFGMVLGVVQVIGMAVTVVSLVIAGIKYMVSSTNEKATIKQQAIPFVVGGTIIFAASTMVKWIANFTAQSINK